MPDPPAESNGAARFRLLGGPGSNDAGDFDSMYRGIPPWDIGRPQPSFLDLKHVVFGRILDAGCGTGEHALMAAEWGFEATGIDAAPTAIGRAREKAAERGLDVRFLVADALDLASLGEEFDTVLDSGLFHVFGDVDRARYVDNLRAVVPTDGRYYLLCFSDKVPGDFGPRRVSKDEIKSSFADGWHVDVIDAVTMEVNFLPSGVEAWRATITRT